MELNINNLYITGTIYTYPEGNQKLLRKRLNYVGTVKDIYHRVVYGDTLDAIAYKYYGTVTIDASKLWWIIADANNILNPLDITKYVGKDIVVPNYYQVRLLTQ